MKLIGIVLLIVGAMLAVAAGLFFILYRRFEHPHNTKKITAHLVNVKHKTNVPVYGKRTQGGPLRILTVLKHWSKGVYEYSVDGKRYTIRYVEHVTERQMPRIVSVRYLKKLPRVAYVETDTGEPSFELCAGVCLCVAILCCVLGTMRLL